MKLVWLVAIAACGGGTEEPPGVVARVDVAAATARPPTPSSPIRAVTPPPKLPDEQPADATPDVEPADDPPDDLSPPEHVVIVRTDTVEVVADIPDEIDRCPDVPDDDDEDIDGCPDKVPSE